MDNRLRNAFDSVHAKEEVKEQTRNYIHYRLYEKRKRKVFHLGYAAVCCLFLLLGFGGHAVYFTPVTFISIDINPSIELGLNRLDRIISVTPYNSDGAVALEDLALKNMKYDDAIQVLLESNTMSTYLSADALINISVASSYDSKNSQIHDRVMECTKTQNTTVSCHYVSEINVQDAHHAGFSFGKYDSFLELQMLYPEITEEDVRGMTMGQIQDLINAFSDKNVIEGKEALDGCGHKGTERGRHGHGSCK